MRVKDWDYARAVRNALYFPQMAAGIIAAMATIALVAGLLAGQVSLREAALTATAVLGAAAWCAVLVVIRRWLRRRIKRSSVASSPPPS